MISNLVLYVSLCTDNTIDKALKDETYLAINIKSCFFF